MGALLALPGSTTPDAGSVVWRADEEQIGRSAVQDVYEYEDWERLKRVRAADQQYAHGRAWARMHQKFRCRLAAEVIIEVIQMDEAAEKAH